MSEAVKTRWVKGYDEPFIFPGDMSDQDITIALSRRFKKEFEETEAFKKHMGKTSPEKAMLIGAGKTAQDFVDGTKYLGRKIAGNQPGLDELAAKRESRRPGYEYLQRQQPSATQTGEILPYFGVPMGLTSRPTGAAVGMIPAMERLANPIKESVFVDSVGTGGLLGLMDYKASSGEGMLAGGAGSGIAKGMTSLLKPTTSRLNGVQAKNAQKGLGLGFKLTPAMQTGSKGLQGLEASMESSALMSGGLDKLSDHNQKKANQIVADALGFRGKTEITPAMLDETADRFTQRYADLLDGNHVQLDDQFLDDLARIESDNKSSWVTGRDLDKVIDKALDDVMQGSISPQRYQQIATDLARKARNNKVNNPDLAHQLQEMRTALDDAVDRSLGAKDEVLTLRADYRVFKNLKKNSVINEDTGNASLRQLKNILRREDDYGYRRGNNTSDLYEATRFMNSFPEAFGNSGTSHRQQIQGLLGASALTGAMGYGSDGSLLTGAGTALLPAAAMYGFGKYYSSPVGRHHFSQGLIPNMSEDMKRLIGNKTGLLAIGATSQ